MTLAEGRYAMHRFPPILLVLALLVAAVAPAAAAEPTAAEIELMTLELERVFQPLAGAIDSRDVVLRKHGRDLYSLSYPLPDGALDARSKSSADDKPLRTLACGHMHSEPTTPASMITAVVSNVDVEYYLWWAAVNRGEEDLERETIVRVTGPEGFEIKVTDENMVPYPANTVTLFVFNPETPFTAPGIYTHRVHVKGAGKAYYRFWVEPLSTTLVER